MDSKRLRAYFQTISHIVLDNSVDFRFPITNVDGENSEISGLFVFASPLYLFRCDPLPMPVEIQQRLTIFGFLSFDTEIR